MHAIIALAIKDLRLLIRDRVALFFTLFFPVLFSIFFGVIFSGSSNGPRGIAICIVDEDDSTASHAFVKKLSDDDRFALVTPPAGASAESLVLHGDAVAYVRLAKGFGQAQDNLIMAFGGGNKPKIEVGVDPSRFAERGMIEGLLQKYAFEGLGTLFSDPTQMLPQLRRARASLLTAPGMDDAFKGQFGDFLNHTDTFMAQIQARQPKPDANPGDSKGSGLAFSPVELTFKDVTPPQTGPASAFQVSFPQGVIWGIMGCTIGFGISLVIERQRGTLARLRIAPMPGSHVLLGKALACFTTICVVCGMLFVLGRFAFGVSIHSVPLLALAVASIGVAFVGLMMLAACSGRTESAASGLSWAVMMIMALLGGAAVPTMFMPGFIQPLASLSPVKWSINAMEGAIWRGFTPAQMLLPCGILIAVGVVTFALGARVFSRRGV